MNNNKNINTDYKNIGIIVAESAEKAQELALKKFPQLKDGNFKLLQDEDCLDTWFSSWLWPISVFDGINTPDNQDINYYYPTNELVTGPDIIFFWVARMIMSGYEYKAEECFKNVYFTGIVRDKLGRKMSKQLGNSPDPIELIEKYGADGVRMGLMLSAAAGNDILFDESLCEQGRNFCNKIWNALRLVKGWEVAETQVIPQENKIGINWFEAVLQKTIAETDDLFAKYKISEALMAIYKLFWDEFSAWLLEIIKPEYQKTIDSSTYEHAIYFFEELLKLLHPFMPFITEELYHALSERAEKETIMFAKINKAENFDEQKISSFEIAKQIIAGIRTIRLQKNIPPKEKLQLFVKGDFNSEYENVIIKLGNLSEIIISDNKPTNSISYLVGTCEFSVPVEINKEEEIAKMQSEIKYLEGFLKPVLAKLANENFVNNAPAQIIENERKKQTDAEEKIKILKEKIENILR